MATIAGTTGLLAGAGVTALLCTNVDPLVRVRGVRILITRIKIDFGDLAAKVLQLSRGCGTPLAGPGGKHDT